MAGVAWTIHVTVFKKQFREDFFLESWETRISLRAARVGWRGFLCESKRIFNCMLFIFGRVFDILIENEKIAWKSVFEMSFEVINGAVIQK